jgi:hypothetical protein
MSNMSSSNSTTTTLSAGAKPYQGMTPSQFWDDDNLSSVSRGPAPEITPPMTIDSEHIMRTAFRIKADRPFNEHWVFYQTLFQDSPKRFYLISPLHQNGPEDRLHISVGCHTSHFHVTFHVYGYLKNGFQITEIQRSTLEGYQTVAKFGSP